MTADEMAELAVSTLDDNKGLDIKNLDVTELTDVTDRIVICTANNSRHASAMADRVARSLRDEGVRPLSTQGEKSADEWILIDFADIVVHIMSKEARTFYSLEKLWGMTEMARQKSADED